MQDTTANEGIGTLLSDDAARICTLTAALLSHLPSDSRLDYHPHYRAIMNTFTSLEKLLYILHDHSARDDVAYPSTRSEPALCKDLEESIHSLCFSIRQCLHQALTAASNLEHMITKQLVAPTPFLYVQRMLAAWDRHWIPPRLLTANTVKILGQQLVESLRSLQVHLNAVDVAVDRESGESTPLSTALALPTIPDLLWFDRHLEFMKMLSHNNVLLPFVPNENIPINKWSGVHVHHCSQDSPSATAFLVRTNQNLRRAFEDLDKTDPKNAYRELSKHVSSVMGVAGPVLQSLASTFCLPTEPWSEPDCDIYPTLTAIFDPTTTTRLSDIAPGSQSMLVRDVLVHLDLKARENTRALRYWIHHVRLVIKAVDPYSQDLERIIPLRTTFSIVDMLVQVVGACASYQRQSNAALNIFHWVQHWTFAASVGLCLTAAFNPDENTHPRESFSKILIVFLTVLFGVFCTYTVIPIFVSQDVNDTFSESLSVLFMDLFLYASQAAYQTLRASQPDIRHKHVIPAMRNVVAELNELVNWWEALRVAIGSISKPHLIYRLNAEQCHKVFENFTSRYVGVTDNRSRPHFGGLDTLVSNSTVMWDNSFVKCPSLHPYIWSKKTRAWEYTTCPLCDVTSTRQMKRQEVLGRREATFEGETRLAKKRRI